MQLSTTHMYLIEEDLFTGDLVEPGDVGDDDGHNEVDHGDGAKDDEEDEEEHGDGLGEPGPARTTRRVGPEVVKLKLAQHHHKHLDHGAAETVKGLRLVVEVNDEEGESEGADKDEESESGPDDPLGDGVVHDGEHAAKEGVATEEED